MGIRMGALYLVPISFKDQTEALLDLKSGINVMNQVFTFQLDLQIQQTNVRALKIDETTLRTYKIVVSIFFVSDQDRKKRFFEKSFFWADIKPDIVLSMLFLTMNNANLDFQAKDLKQRCYTIEDILPTTKKVKLIGKKEFAATALDLEYETFVVYVNAFGENLGDEMYP